MTGFDWSADKNQELIEGRGISFERVVSEIEQGQLLDVLDHPNQHRYPGQLIYAVNIDGYVYLVPFVKQKDGTRFLKTIIPSRKRHAPTGGNLMGKKMTEEERDILDAFESGELKRATDASAEHEAASESARNTFNKTRRVNLRVTERDFSLAHSRAREEGIPYQTLLSSVVHKYLSGRLVEKP